MLSAGRAPGPSARRPIVRATRWGHEVPARRRGAGRRRAGRLWGTARIRVADHGGHLVVGGHALDPGSHTHTGHAATVDVTESRGTQDGVEPHSEDHDHPWPRPARPGDGRRRSGTRSHPAAHDQEGRGPDVRRRVRAEGAESVIATLAREQVPATFFLTGTFADKNPSLSVRLARLGLVANHTSSHPHLTQLSDSQVRAQVVSAHAAILRATGKDPHPLFRFPYGEYDARTLRLVNSLGYVLWAGVSTPWGGRTSRRHLRGSGRREDRGRSFPGEIVLMHLGAAPDGSTLDADALTQVIREARSAGYGFVTLGQL